MSEMIDFAPEDIPDISAEQLLDSLTLGVMRNNIVQQIRGKVSTQQNFLSIVIEKFEIIEKNVENPDILREIQYEIIDFCRGLILEITDFYNLAYDDDYGTSKQVIEIISVLYNFFIARGEEFVRTFFINYIQNNRTRLLKEIGVTTSTEDVTSLSSAKKNVQTENIQLLQNMDAIINFVAGNYIDPFEFIQTIDDGDFYISKLKEYLTDDIIIGDFANQYIMQFTDDYSSEQSTNIRNQIRAAFIS